MPKPAAERQAAAEPQGEEGAATGEGLDVVASSETPVEAAAVAARPAVLPRPAVSPVPARTKPSSVAGSARGRRPELKKGKRVLPRNQELESRAEKARKVVFGVFSTVAVAGILFYALKSSGFIRIEPDPKAALQAIATVRSLQSTQAGQTVDQAMNNMLESARTSGTLVSSQGWFVRWINGESGRVKVIFSFDEKQGKREADFLVDLSNNSVIPGNDLAAYVYNKQ